MDNSDREGVTMSDSRFGLTVLPADDEPVVKLHGEVDMVTAPRLSECLEQLARDGARGSSSTSAP